MFRKQIKISFFFIIFILCFSVISVYGGVTGKIMGKVVDKKSNDPIPGVNIEVEGELMGAATDIDGFYIILNIRPGTYTLKASMLGYASQIIKNVQVFADQTTTINFTLSEESLSLGEEIVVVAEQPLIQKDKTSSISKVTSKEIETLPIIKTTSELISLMPGVSLDGLNRIRGSDDHEQLSVSWGGQGGSGSGDVKTIIDGVLMNNYDGFAGFAGSDGIRDLPTSSIEEISVHSGAIPAEYGNANGGIISMYTKEGMNRYQLVLDYKYNLPGKKHWGANVYDSPMLKDNVAWDDSAFVNTIDPVTGKLFHVRDDYTHIGGHIIEGNLSGPLPFFNKIKFSFSGKHIALAPIYPAATDRGFYDQRGNFVPSTNDFLGTLNLTYNITPHIKLKVGGILNQYISYISDYYDPFLGSNIVQGTIRNIDETGRNIFLPKNWAAGGQQFKRDLVGFVRFTHALSPRTYYDLVLGYSQTTLDTLNVPSLTDQNRRIGYFNAGHQGAFWQVSDRKRLEVKFDLASQMNKYNLVKFGIDAIFYNNYLTMFQSGATSTGRSPVRRRFVYYGSGPGTKGLNEPVKPFQLSFYLQDKLEFNRLVINIGGRFDYFNPNSREVFDPALLRTPMYNTLTRANYAPTEKTPSIFTFSPRLGIAHPLSERAVIHFSGGVFQQLPDFFWIYGKTYGSDKEQDDDLNGNGKIDPAEKYNTFRPAFGMYFGRQAGRIRPEQSTNLEVGADYNFYEDYTAGIAIYYKSERDQFLMHANSAVIGTELDALKMAKSDDNWFATISNGAFGDTRGIELSIRKRMSNYFSFELAYNLQWVNSEAGGRSVSDELISVDPRFFYSSENYWGDEWYNGNYVYYKDFIIDPETGAEIPVRPSKEEMDEMAALYENYNNIYNQRTWGYYSNAWLEPLQPANGRAGEAGFLLANSGYYYESTSVYKIGNPTNFGKATFVFVTPPNWDFGPKWLGQILSNITLNYIYKMSTGTEYYFQPINTNRKESRTLPIYTNTDLSISKTINTIFDITLYVNIMNLFNQRDARYVNDRNEYTKNGLITAKPYNKNYIKYGDTDELWRYYGSPRNIFIGARIMF